MKNSYTPTWILAGFLRLLGILAAGVLLVVIHVGCASVVDEAAIDQRVQALEVKVLSLEASVQGACG